MGGRGVFPLMFPLMWRKQFRGCGGTWHVDLGWAASALRRVAAPATTATGPAPCASHLLCSTLSVPVPWRRLWKRKVPSWRKASILARAVRTHGVICLSEAREPITSPEPAEGQDPLHSREMKYGWHASVLEDVKGAWGRFRPALGLRFLFPEFPDVRVGQRFLIFCYVREVGENKKIQLTA